MCKHKGWIYLIVYFIMFPIGFQGAKLLDRWLNDINEQILVASGGGNFGGFVPASYAAFTSAAGREISCVSMAFECYLRISFGFRCIDQYICSRSNIIYSIWLYV